MPSDTMPDTLADPRLGEVKLWLWRNGDHFWAFDNEYPCYPGGDPMTLGEPVGVAIFKPSVPRDVVDARPTTNSGQENIAQSRRLEQPDV